MSKKDFKAENDYSKDKNKKAIHPLQKISSGLSKAQAESMAKLSN